MCDVDLTKEPNKLASINKLISSSSKYVYILFFKDTCPACVVFKPHFMKYREKCITSNSKAVMVMVNGATSPELFKSFKIEAIPTLFVYKNGKLVQKIVGGNTEALESVMKLSGM